MDSTLERRRGSGRRRSDRDALAVRGLLHDVGHELTALSCLVEAARGDVSLQADSSCRLELLAAELSRLQEIVRQGMKDLDPVVNPEPVAVRGMVAQLAAVAGAVHPAEVTSAPGPEVVVDVNASLLWRVLGNVVDNAARAAGPGGRVVLSVLARPEGALVEVADDGPGFGAGPPGLASVGMEVVDSLLGACGGSLDVQTAPGAGTVVGVRLPGHTNAAAWPAGVGGGAR